MTLYLWPYVLVDRQKCTKEFQPPVLYKMLDGKKAKKANQPCRCTQINSGPKKFSLCLNSKSMSEKREDGKGKTQ